jgi:hypothetical protein
LVADSSSGVAQKSDRAPRKLSDQDYAGFASVAELERRGRDLVPVRAATPPVKSDGSALSWAGNRLRVGLTAHEIELVKSRIRELLARPDLAQLSEPR